MVEAALALSRRDAVREGERKLRAAGCETPRLDAELLLAAALGCTRAELVREAPVALGEEALLRFRELIRRREAREPVAYILGVKPFRNLDLSVDRRALIPRPETELLVEVGLSLPAHARVVDVGTGCGAIALALKHERPDLEVHATDVSAEAIALARANAMRLGLEVHLHEADMVPLAPGLEPYAVLANLPYIPDGTRLEAEIARYEPASSLFGGPDGLAGIRRLASCASDVPLMALEVGFDQADAVAAVLRAAGFGSTERLRDLAGHDRVVIGRR